MWLDIVDLDDFYRSDLGRLATGSLRRRILDWWPDPAGGCVVGLGYATPFLPPFLDSPAPVIALMPGRVGVTRWPAARASRACLCHEDRLPLPELSVDRLLLVHCLEHVGRLRRCLREMWRVLAPDGRMIVVVPNRRSIWARLDHTPFGHGQPYSTRQLRAALRDSMFMPLRSTTALAFPPGRRRFMLATAPAWEKIGWLQPLGGALLIEAGKQIYGGSPVAAVQGYRRPLPQTRIVAGPARDHRVQTVRAQTGRAQTGPVRAGRA